MGPSPARSAGVLQRGQATCLGSSGLGGGILLARFRLKDGKWRSVSLKGEQGSPIQDIAVYGTQETERRILLLSSKKWILTDWIPMNGLPREIYESIGVAEGEESEVDQEREREGFARDLRADYDLGEFRVSGSLRAAWYQGQRADPNLNRASVLAADGLLERKSDATGPEKEIWVPVVPPGNAYGGCSWRRACFDQVHCGWLGGHRSADCSESSTGTVCTRMWYVGLRIAEFALGGARSPRSLKLRLSRR